MQTQHVGKPDEKMEQEMSAHNNRLNSWYEIEAKTWSDAREVVPGSGIWVYEDVIPKSMNVINRLEEVILDKNNQYGYMEALVGYGIKMPEYRDLSLIHI